MATLKEALAHGLALHKTAAFRVRTVDDNLVLEAQEADGGCTPIESWWRPARKWDDIPEDEWELREEGEWMGDVD